jgi:tyrosine-protein kinase Etk/Wzc
MTAGPNTPRPPRTMLTFGSTSDDVPPIGPAEDRFRIGEAGYVSESMRPRLTSAHPSTFPLHAGFNSEVAADYPELPQGFTLAEIGGLLKARWGFIVLAGLVTFAGVIAWTLNSPMKFGATSSLYLGELAQQPRGSQELDLSGDDRGDVGSEIEIIKSRASIKRAVLASGANVSVGQPGWAPPRYLAWRLSNRSSHLVDGSRAELHAVNTDGPEGTYRVRFTTNQTYEVHSEGALLGVGRLDEAGKFGELRLTLTPGKDQRPHAGREYDLAVESLSDVIDDSQLHLDVWAPKSTLGSESIKVVTLEFTADSPALAARFLEELMKGYLGERQLWKAEEATAAEKFVSTQLAGTRENLDAAQSRLAAYRSGSPIVVLNSEAEAMINQISRYEEQRVASTLELASLQDIEQSLKKDGSRIEAFMVGETKDAVLTGMATSLAQSRARLAELQTRFSSEAPDVIQAQAQVNAELRSIQSYVGNRLSRARQNMGSLNGIISKYEDKLKAVPAAEAGLAQLTREAEVFSATYSYLLKRQQETAIQKASTVSKNRVLDPAEASTTETSPKLPLRLSSFPLGMMLGAVLVMSRGLTSGRLQTESHARRIIGNIPVAARVPRLARRAPPVFELPARGHFFDYVEAFRLLRTNLYDAGLASGGRIVLITSPSPGDGKTTCTLALASMLTAGFRSVLVVDTDLRKQSHRAVIGKAMGEATGHDLTGVLRGTSEWRDAIRKVHVGEGSFDSIEGGVASSAELLSSEAFGRFLDEAREHYDYVLLDSPSYPLVSDALVLSSAADCVLTIIKLGHTPEVPAIEHIKRLSRASAGYAVVLNGVVSQPRAYGAGYGRRPAA